MKIRVSYEGIQQYVLENNLTGQDAIILHPDDYNNIATDHFNENNLMIFRPVEIFGTPVHEDTTGDVKRHEIYVVPLAAS